MPERGGMTVAGLIFDFDGVIADSEALANTVLAEHVGALGLPTTLDDSLARYMGKRWPDVIALIQDGVGRVLPAGFSEDLKAATLERLAAELREVEGAGAFIRRFQALPRCIASSSSPDRLRLCLNVLGLADTFADMVFSADMVERGKPHPDVFLLAADRLRIAPRHCLVIEDSVSGVQAGVEAGMTVLGLCAGSHLREGHAARLLAAGASRVAASWAEAADWVATRL